MGGITVFIPQIIYKILGLLPGPMSARRAAGMWKPASSSWGCDMSDMLLVWLLMLCVFRICVWREAALSSCC